MRRNLAAKDLDRYVPEWNAFSDLAQRNILAMFDPLAWSNRDTDDDEIGF
jgi:hypothetical protein